MTKLPRTREELIADELAHPDRGMIAGEAIVPEGSIELRLVISKQLYNDVLQVGASVGLGSKSNIAIAALSELLIKGVPDHSLLPASEQAPDDSREFRAMLPLALHRLLQDQGMSLADIGKFALLNFVEARRSLYNKFVQQWTTKHNVTREDVARTIEDYWRKLGRKKRLNLVNEGSSEALERKML